MIGADNCLVFIRHGGSILRVHNTRVSLFNETHPNTSKKVDDREQTRQGNQSLIKELPNPCKPKLLNIPNIDYSDNESEDIDELPNDTEDEEEDIEVTNSNDKNNLEKYAVEENKDGVLDDKDIEKDEEVVVNLKKNDVVQFKDIDGEIIQAKVLGRAGKVGGKYENWFNLQDNNSSAVYVEDRRKMNELKDLYHNIH